MENVPPPQQCIFCQIKDGQIPAKKVYEDEDIMGILDINPANKGHVLLFPKQHFPILPLVTDDVRNSVVRAAKKVSSIMLKVLDAKGTNVFIANGGVAGQKAQHFLMHIIPSYEGDDVNFVIPKNDMVINVKDKIVRALDADAVQDPDDMDEDSDNADEDNDDENSDFDGEENDDGDNDDDNEAGDEIEEDDVNGWSDDVINILAKHVDNVKDEVDKKESNDEDELDDAREDGSDDDDNDDNDRYEDSDDDEAENNYDNDIENENGDENEKNDGQVDLDKISRLFK